jgi:hypothetical protein
MGRFIRDPGVTLDYNKQPYPLFGVWDNYNNSTYSFSVFDSDYQPVSRTGNLNYNGLASEMVGAIVSTTNANTTTSAGSYIKGTPQISADGHPGFAGNADGSYTWKGYGGLITPFSNFGVIIGPEGYRQNFSLYSMGRSIGTYNRGTAIPLETLTLTATTHVTFSSAAIVAGRGLIAYNRNTSTLVWMEPVDNTGGSYRIHQWMNPNRKITGKTAELLNFITEAKAKTNGASYSYFEFTWSPNAAGNAEAYYRARIFPCNNGKIAISRMLPSNRIEFCVLTPATTTPAADGAITATFQYKTSLTLTTSYGTEQGNDYGIKHNISWDNRWVMTYCPYYYYHCGMLAFVINIDDPNTYYTYSNPGSADGIQCLPLGRSGFILGLSSGNSDGNVGMYTTTLDASQPKYYDGTTLTIGQALSGPSYNGLLDVAYTSTNYPCILPIERWFTQGAGQNG